MDTKRKATYYIVIINGDGYHEAIGAYYLLSAAMADALRYRKAHSYAGEAPETVIVKALEATRV